MHGGTTHNGKKYNTPGGNTHSGTKKNDGKRPLANSHNAGKNASKFDDANHTRGRRRHDDCLFVRVMIYQLVQLKTDRGRMFSIELYK
jgi:hypothetical protein